MAPKLRSASIFWAEKVVLVLDALQVYALLWTMAQAWPWPAPWLKWTRFALAFNLDVFTLAQSSSAGSTGGSAVDYVRGGVIFSPWGQRSGYLMYSTAFCIIPLLFALFAQHSVRTARRGRAVAAAGRQWQRRNRHRTKDDAPRDDSAGWCGAAMQWAKSKWALAAASAPASAVPAQTLLLRQGTQEQLSLLEKQADAAEAEPAHLVAAEAAAAAAAEERADMLWAAVLLGAYVLTLPLGSATLRLLHCVVPAHTRTSGAFTGKEDSVGTVLLGDPSVRCWDVQHTACTAFCACIFVSAALLVPIVVYKRYKQVVSTPNPRPRTAMGLMPSASTLCASCAVCCAEIGCGEWGTSGSHASSPVDAAAQHERCMRATELEYALGLNDDWSESNGWLFSSFTLPATRLWASSAALKLLALSVVYAPPLRDAHELWALQAAIFFAAQLWWWWLVTGGVSPPEPPPPPAWVSAEAELREHQDLEQQVDNVEKQRSQEKGVERAPARRRRPQSAGAEELPNECGANHKAHQNQADIHQLTAYGMFRRALPGFCRRGCFLSACLPGSARGNVGQKSRWRHATAPWRWARPAAFRCASTAFLARTLAYIQVIFAGIGLAKASGSKSALLVSNRLLGLLVACGACSCAALALAWCHARTEHRDGCDNGLWCAPSPNAAENATRPSKQGAKAVPAETSSATAEYTSSSSSTYKHSCFTAVCSDRGWPVPRAAIEMFLHHSAPALGSDSGSGKKSAVLPIRDSAAKAFMAGGGRRGSTIASMVAAAMVARKVAGSSSAQGGLSSVVTGHAKWLVVLQAAQLLSARLRDLQPADAGAGAGAVGAAKEIEALLGLEVELVGDTGESADDAQAFGAVTAAEDQDAARTAAEEAAEIKADAADWTTACAIQRVLDELHDACDQASIALHDDADADRMISDEADGMIDKDEARRSTLLRMQGVFATVLRRAADRLEWAALRWRDRRLLQRAEDRQHVREWEARHRAQAHHKLPPSALETATEPQQPPRVRGNNALSLEGAWWVSDDHAGPSAVFDDELWGSSYGDLFDSSERSAEGELIIEMEPTASAGQAGKQAPGDITGRKSSVNGSIHANTAENSGERVYVHTATSAAVESDSVETSDTLVPSGLRAASARAATLLEAARHGSPSALKLELAQQQLKSRLRRWESEWKAAHDGREPSLMQKKALRPYYAQYQELRKAAKAAKAAKG